ncbi:MAG: hypothetical protein J2P13_08015 [Acidobacteria bacterium]|nr:hypothetical protein [Acidobacteriota bacterium]
MVVVRRPARRRCIRTGYIALLVLRWRLRSSLLPGRWLGPHLGCPGRLRRHRSRRFLGTRRKALLALRLRHRSRRFLLRRNALLALRLRRHRTRRFLRTRRIALLVLLLVLRLRRRLRSSLLPGRWLGPHLG